jgi:hypothetical protein
MDDFDRQIQRCRAERRQIERLIDGLRRQVRDAERDVANYRRLSGGERDAQRARDRQRDLLRDIDRRRQDIRSLDRQIDETRRRQRRAG